MLLLAKTLILKRSGVEALAQHSYHELFTLGMHRILPVTVYRRTGQQTLEEGMFQALSPAHMLSLHVGVVLAVMQMLLSTCILLLSHGIVIQDSHKGDFADMFLQVQSSANLDLVDISGGLSDLLACKDPEEIKKAKKAAFLAASALQKWAVPQFESKPDDLSPLASFACHCPMLLHQVLRDRVKRSCISAIMTNLSCRS